MVAPFWADVDTRKNPGRVFYRETTDNNLTAWASRQIRPQFVNLGNFEANWMFIATWYNVTFYGGSEVTPVLLL